MKTKTKILVAVIAMCAILATVVGVYVVAETKVPEFKSSLQEKYESKSELNEALNKCDTEFRSYMKTYGEKLAVSEKNKITDQYFKQRSKTLENSPAIEDERAEIENDINDMWKDYYFNKEDDTIPFSNKKSAYLYVKYYEKWFRDPDSDMHDYLAVKRACGTAPYAFMKFNNIINENNVGDEKAIEELDETKFEEFNNNVIELFIEAYNIAYDLMKTEKYSAINEYRLKYSQLEDYIWNGLLDDGNNGVKLSPSWCPEPANKPVLERYVITALNDALDRWK